MVWVEGGSGLSIIVSALSLSVVAAIVAWRMVLRHSFPGKRFYALTFVAVIWTLVCVGFEAASQSAETQLGWAMTAWWGNAAVPVA